jgi:hypothetical protein
MHDAYQPKIALTGNDTVHVTWRHEYGFVRLPYRRSINGGLDFTEMIELLIDSVTYPYQALFPLLITNGNYVRIFFTGATASYPPIYMITSSNGGSTWSQVSAITTDRTSEVSAGSVSADSIILVYPPVDERWKLLRSKDSGFSWTRTNEDLDDYAKVALTSGMLHLVQHKWIPPAVEIQYRQSTDLGTSWSIDSVLSTVDIYWSDLPTIAGYTNKCGTELLVAWRDLKYGWFGCCGGSIISRASIDNGKSWLQENKLTTKPDGTEPDAAINGNVRAVSWATEYIIDDTFHVSATATNNSLLHYSAPVDLTPDSYTDFFRGVAVSGHAVHLTWCQKVGSTFRIFYRRGEFVQTNAQFSVATGFLEMDTTGLNQTVTDSIIVSNPGSDPLVIGTMISDNESFNVTTESDTVEAGRERIFYIHFIPKHYGVSSGKILFYHNGQTSPDCITVTGTCRWNIDTIKYRANYWNLVSIPVKSNQYYQLPSMFAYEENYVSKDTMVLGVGYWAKPDSTVHYEGEMVWDDTITLKQGWNMIGSLSAPVVVQNITTIPEANIQSVFYGYDGINYVQADTLFPGQAYWVKLKREGKLVLKMK